MASSSLAIDSYDHYDVFLSFRGEDTRYNFTSHLNDALCRNNIKAFIDYRINRGDEITPVLEKVIECAKISIIVFSKNYADSTFCLDELARIMESKESKAQIVLPIFYKVDPSEVTYQEAFARHETNANWRKRRRGETIEQGRKQVERWKSAFVEALGLAGWHIVENSDETKIIGEIIKEVSEKLNNSLSKGEELICTSLVGLAVEKNFEKIWECLMNDKISRVGVYGMGGVGKTTIATRINNQLLEVPNSFTHIYWVTVSKDSSIYNLQSGIAKKINLDLSKEDDEKRRAAMIQKKLSNKKFALILDDVWEAFEIEDVGIPFLVDGKKLLMTSRSRRVCERMECKPIEVKPLFEKEALDLFIKESKCQINDSLQLGDIVGSIVKECGGLPLAIVVIARTMRGVKEIWKWRDTLRELQKPCEGENPEIEEKIFKVLKFSYDRLPNDRCRKCFLYCSLFPEDYNFRRCDLIEYWISEGLIDGLESRYEELDKSNCILDELIHACLLESTVNYEHREQIKMHDVIRDMAHKNVKVGLQIEDSFETVQVLTVLKSFPNSTPHCSKLKTLLLQGHDIRELSSFFFVNIQSLSILHLRDIYGVKSIPDSITNLGNLRLLLIYGCSSLEYIPSLAGLEKLLHLKISMNVTLKKISKGIERLVNLRVLDLSRNESLDGSFVSGVVEKLSHLQTLNLYGSKIEVEVEALISLVKLETLYVYFYNLYKFNCYLKSGHWRRLLRYHIHYGEHRIPYMEEGMWLKIMSLEAIRVVEEGIGEFGMFLPYDIQYLNLLDWESSMFYYLKNPNFANLRSISIRSCKSRYLFTVELAQHLLHNVQYLRIEFCDELEEIIGRGKKWVNRSNYINYPTILLPNLKKLRLLDLSKLRSIYRGRMVCPSLECIHFDACDKIERLPFCVEKVGNTQNPIIKLQQMMSRRWWDSLLWDDPNAKAMYQTPKLWASEDDIV